MKPKFSTLVAVSIVASLAAITPSQTEQRPPRQGGGAPGAPLPQMGPVGSAQQVTLKPYADVITKETKSFPGVFTVHRLGGKVLWEIPTSKFGLAFLWQAEIAQVPTGSNYPGTPAGSRILSFERRENLIYVREQRYDVRSAGNGMDLGVKWATIPPIVTSFPVEAESATKSAVIDVTRLFTQDQPPFSVGAVVGASGVDLSRSYIEKVSAFPTNIETRSQLTFAAPSPKTAIVHYSLVQLPEKQIMARFRDDRVGFFGTNYTVYGHPDQKAVDQTIINRFRLEKKDPDAVMSEPVKPITFYLGREVPEKWRPFLKRGVEAWNVAFEKAGFKNAIVCKYAPTEKEDPNWDAEDARYSVIRWAPSTTANAIGPHVADPRSGETISAHIIIWHNVLQLVQQWYFPQAAQVDSRARKFPFPDDLMGRLVEYVACHEVGHTLGLEHNFKASTAYTVEQLRTPGFVAKHGVASSIMSYSRYNYVAQPSDNVSTEDMIGRIGSYDIFAIAWGYTPIPFARTPEDEKPTLDGWAAQQLKQPDLQFGNYAHPEDPTTQSECIGSDPVKSSELGLQNINRIAQFLIPATYKLGEDYSGLKDAYNALLGQRRTEISRVTRYIGGVVETNGHVGRGPQPFVPVSKEMQRNATRFVVFHTTNYPKALLNPAVTTKIFPAGDVGRVAGTSALTLSSLFSEQRVQRLLDFEAQSGAQAYTVSNLADDIQSGIFRELGESKPAVDIYRRAIQINYLNVVDQRINGATATKSDLNGILRDNLKTLATQVDRALNKVADDATSRHLRETRRLIGLIVLGKYVPPTGGGIDILAALGLAASDMDPLGCGPVGK